MPGAKARNPDGEAALFTAPVLQWLLRHGCRGAIPVDGAAAGDDPEWTTLPVGPHGSPASGWRFGWRDDDGGDHRLLLVFTDRDALPAQARAALAGYLAFAARCAGGGAGAAAIMDREQLSRAIHDLRNGLNSLLMNAAVLAAKLPPADRDGRFARQVQADGDRCATLLQALADTTRPPDAPLAG